MVKKASIYIMVLTALLLTLSGCGTNGTPANTPTNTPAPTANVSPTVTVAPTINPDNGVVDDDDGIINDNDNDNDNDDIINGGIDRDDDDVDNNRTVTPTTTP